MRHVDNGCRDDRIAANKERAEVAPTAREARSRARHLSKNAHESRGSGAVTGHARKRSVNHAFVVA